VAESLRAYVRRDQPFGPPDAAEIREPACAAALFDWNNEAFAELLTGSDVLVGRRGSGKSALLSTFKGRRFMKGELSGEEGREYRERHNLNAKTLLAIADVVIEANTPELVDHLEQHCRQRSSIPPVEVMARLWNIRIWLLIGACLRENYSHLWDQLPGAVRDFALGKDVIAQALQDASSGHLLAPEDYVREMEQFLATRETRCVVTFDNIERYKVDDVQNAVIGGLIAATGKLISRQHHSLDIKLCLPAEIFDHIRSVVFRPDKDLHRVQYLHWTSAELMHVAASRLKVYLQLFDEEAFAVVKDSRLADRATLRTFWTRYLPAKITNALGTDEETFTYLLRHTHLLPRQLLTTLNAIARRASRDGRGMLDRPFEAEDIVQGVQDSEDANAQAVLGMYEPVYPHIREVFDLVMPRLTRVFDYGFLHSTYNSSAKRPMAAMNRGDFRQFWRLMLSTGAVGVVDAESVSTIYATAKFEFNSQHALKISDKDMLCVHPMFSRIYNVNAGGESRAVLPRGSEVGVELRSV